MPAMPGRAARFWADLPLRLKGLTVIAIPPVALIAGAVSFALVDRQQRAADDLVAHTLEVRGEIEHVLTLLVDAQTGVRGYLLAGDDRFLEPNRRAEQALPGAIARLRALVGDNPAQVARADRVEQLSRESIATLAALRAASTGVGNALPPASLALMDDNKVTMDALRAELGAMRAEEERLLAERTARRRGRRR